MDAPIESAPTGTASDRAAIGRAAFERRTSMVFAAEFLSLGLFIPFYPVWLASQGMKPDEISFILAVQTGLRLLVVPAVLRRADRARDRADILLVFAWVSALLVNLLYVVDSFPAVFVATVLICLVWAPVVPLADAIALSGVRRLGSDYGRTRLWGSLAFIVMNLIAGGVTTLAGPGAVLPMMTATFLLAALVALAAPRVGRPRFATPLPPGPVGAPATAPRPFLSRLRPEADLRRLAPTLLALGLIQSSHAMYNGFASILWGQLGYSGTAIGLFWSIGVVAEVVMFRYSGRLGSRLGPQNLLILAGAFAVTRWLAMGFDLGFTGFCMLAAFHGLSFGAAWVALQATIARSVGESRIGSAQGLGFAIQTGLTAGATFAAGPLYDVFGAKAYATMALLAATGLLIGLAYPQRARLGGETCESR